MSTQVIPSEDPAVIIYGGAFDPPHMGHVSMIRLALARFPEATVCVLPAAQPAAAGRQTKVTHASFQHRCAMARLAFGEGASQRVRVLATEQDLPAPNYTLNTLRQITDQYPAQRLGFLLGQDQLQAFAHWHEPRAILSLAALLVVARPGAGMPSLRASVQAASEELQLALTWLTPVIASLQMGSTAYNMYLLGGRTSDASSTELRRRLRTGKSLPHAWLPPAVAAYIKQEKLYTEREV